MDWVLAMGDSAGGVRLYGGINGGKELKDMISIEVIGSGKESHLMLSFFLTYNFLVSQEK